MNDQQIIAELSRRLQKIRIILKDSKSPYSLGPRINEDLAKRMIKITWGQDVP